jgi:alcohol dehydrogenase class IV
MVKPFQFARVPKIIFRNGVINDLPAIAASFGNDLILVTGESSFLKSSPGGKLLNDLERKGIRYSHVRIKGEPSPPIIDKAVQENSGRQVNLVVGIGGGSVLDAGKAISAMMYRSESVREYLEGVGTMEHPGTKLPYLALPTTSGTGSEATKNAVISQTGTDGFKKSLRHDNFVPDIAVIDPDLTLSCSPEITAASGMDCFTQLTEAYLSDRSIAYTDALAWEGLKVIKDSLVNACRNGDDRLARTGMSFAALTSGICLANAGLGVIHGFASSIGGIYDISHGIICGTLMAKSNELNVRELRKRKEDNAALKKYAALGRLFLDLEGKTDDYYIDGFIVYLHGLTNELQLPGLGKYGFAKEMIVKVCSATDLKNNPVKLGVSELAEIIAARYE